MTLDEALLRILIIAQCLADDAVCLGFICLVRIIGGSVNQEVLGYSLLDVEVVEDGGIVIVGSEVDGSCRRDVYVGTHATAAQVIGIVVELAFLGIAIVTIGAIYSVYHIVVLMAEYLVVVLSVTYSRRIIGWGRL